MNINGKKALFLFLFCLCLPSSLRAEEEWRAKKGEHFIIYYKNAPDEFLNKINDKAEEYYNKIAADLGFTRYDFWLWENRASIYIYDNAKAYQEATGQPDWSGGCAQISKKVIYTYPGAQGFLEDLLPHEMGHIIFREFVGFYNPAVPLWLDEGVASYQEKTKYLFSTNFINNAIKNGNFISLTDLDGFNLRGESSKEKVRLFYAESFSVVDFLIKRFGSDKFVLFCQNLRDKKNLERAISSAYPFENISALDIAWQNYLKSR